MEGVVESRGAKMNWWLVDLPHLQVGRSPLPTGGAELDGAIVWADRRDRWIEPLLEKGVKVINCGSDWLGVPGVATVRTRITDLGAAVVGHFLGLGFQHLVLIGHLLDKRQGTARMLGDVAASARGAGMTAEIWDLGGRADPADDPKRLLQPEKERRLMAFLKALPGHVGVYCESDHVGVIVCRVAGLLGLRIPEDLAVMGFGDNLVSRFSDPPLTSVVTPGRAIGRLAAMSLSRWLKHDDAPPNEQLVGGIELTLRESTLGSSGSPELARVRRRIATHGARGLAVSDLVTISGLSVKTLVRRYKEAFGTDPSDDIRKVRLAEATRLLKETGLSIAEIAAECGFSSQAGFYNYLKRHAGWGPSDLRKTGA